jgi:hypothetical protein
MATLADVEALATALPSVTEGLRWGRRRWFVDKKQFCWDAPLGRADIKRFGDRPIPEGEIVATRVEDLDEKKAVLESGIKGVFTTEHFNGYPAVLIQLKVVSKEALRRLVEDGWLAAAPPRLAKEYLASRG